VAVALEVEHLLLSRTSGTLNNEPEFLLELFDELRSFLPLARRLKIAA
jgi:hypothetical protein